MAGMMSSVPPEAIMAVTNRQLIAERTGNNINCLTERRITKLRFDQFPSTGELTDRSLLRRLEISQTREFGRHSVWKKDREAPRVGCKPFGQLTDGIIEYPL
jgi:hypothetical protein